jgi:hypothetical protein
MELHYRVILDTPIARSIESKHKAVASRDADLNLRSGGTDILLRFRRQELCGNAPWNAPKGGCMMI